MAGDKGVDTRAGTRQGGPARTDQQAGYRGGRSTRPNTGGRPVQGQRQTAANSIPSTPVRRQQAGPARKPVANASKRPAEGEKVRLVKKRAEGATPANFVTKGVKEPDSKARPEEEGRELSKEEVMNGTSSADSADQKEHAEQDNAEHGVNGEADDVVVFRNGEENVIMTPEPERDVKKAEQADVISPPPSRLHHPHEGEKFDVECFHASVRSFMEVFSSAHYQTLHDEYRVDQVIEEVPILTDQLKKYKAFIQSTVGLVEELRPLMKTAQENIRLSYSREAFGITSDDDLHQTVEQRRQAEKHARLKAEVAKANAEVAEAVRLSADAEATAVRAHLMADRAEEEAERLAQEAEHKRRVEEERRIAEEKRKEEERRKKEEEERRQEEQKRRKEEEWRRRENSSSNKPGKWENWPVFDYNDPHVPDSGVACVIRGNPAKFRQEDAKVEILDQSSLQLPFHHNEELISHVVSVTSPRGETTFEEPIYVAIPHTLSRGGALSREAVVKQLEGEGRTLDLPTSEVSIEQHKDMKFAQAEVTHPCKIFVMSQLKRDYVTLGRKHHTVTSSYDHRVSVTLERDTLSKTDHFLLQVHPVDSASINEFRSRDPYGKGLLTSSPLVITQWESSEFQKPVLVSVPCPPNPARARKLAELKKQKEEKMKKAPAPPPTIDELDREEERKKEKIRQLQQLQQQLLAGEEEEAQEKPRGPTRWYMGQYAASDDDEHDLLYLLTFSHHKWSVCHESSVTQAKVDLLSFQLSKPCEQFMVLRTKTNVDEEEAVFIVSNLNAFLHRRAVQMLLRQKSSDPCEVAVAVVPVSQVERQVRKMEEHGYDEGPPPSPTFSLTEGDFLQVHFKGNIRNQDKEEVTWYFHSNKPAILCVSVEEVDRYLQRNFPAYRGALELVCPSQATPTPSRQPINGRGKGRGESPEKGALAHMMITLPKDNVEQPPPPKMAPVVIRDPRDPVNTDLLRQLAADLGDEWRLLARELGVTSMRVQAIHRNVAAAEGTEEELKYQILLAWLKRAPKAADKVNVLGVALTRTGRPDLADSLRSRKEDYRAAMTAH